MKICHVSEYCHAAGYGGTERYILELIRALDGAGWANSIGWLCSEKDMRPFTLDGIRIVPVFSSGSRVDRLDRLFEPNATRTIFRDEKPDILHFHTFGRAEAAIARLAVEQGVPYAFTYHTPSLSCRRETLLRWGQVRCDGEVRTLRCAACKLQERLDSTPALAYLGMGVSVLPGYFVGRFASGKLHRRAAFVEDTSRFRTELRQFLGQAGLVVSCCEWSTPVLARNGALPDRLLTCPQGVGMGFVQAARECRPASAPATFNIGYVGRLAPSKGIHILVEAFSRTTCPEARLRIYGWSPNDAVRQYTYEVMMRASRDPRISFLPKLPLERMVEEYGKLSLLAIPSVGLETGPLVLFEALQMGLAVIGSDRVGQLELLQRHGVLVEPHTPAAWEAALNRALEAWGQKQRMSETFGFREIELNDVRTMGQVSQEMDAAYRRLSGPPANP